MSNLPLDRLSAGYALPFLEQIKYAIRSMPYGDTMVLAQVIKATGPEDEHTFAHQLWEWANADQTEEEQTESRGTSIPRGGESDIPFGKTLR